MDTVPMVNLEEHQSLTMSGSSTVVFSTPDSSSECSALTEDPSATSSPEHRENESLPEPQNSEPSGSNEGIPKQEKHFCGVTEFMAPRFSEEPGHEPLIPARAPWEPAQNHNLLVSSHEQCITPPSPKPVDDSYGDIPDPVPFIEGHPDVEYQKDVAAGISVEVVKNVNSFSLAEDLNSAYKVKGHLKMNGHIITPLSPKEEDCSILPLSPTVDDAQTLSLPVTGSETSNSDPKSWDLPRIVKHKPSSITFSDYTCPISTNQGIVINESSDGEEESSLEDDGDGDGGDYNDGDDDDVFLELPQSKEFLVSRKRRNNGKDKMRRSAISSQKSMDICHTDTNGGYEAEQEASSRERSPHVKSPWSESMNQLMRKLDQLNLDIEEALSASSSPCNTPSTIRKKQSNAVSRTALNQSLNSQVLRRSEKEECQSHNRSPTPRITSVGIRTKNKKTTMFSRMTNAGAGKQLYYPEYQLQPILPIEREAASKFKKQLP